MISFDHMTAAEYRAYLQSLASGKSSEPSEKTGELPASRFGRMSAAEYRALLKAEQQPSGRWPELRLLYHVPNEGQRSIATGGRMRAEGLKSGVPDLCLPSAHGKYHGLYIEMKRTKGSKTSQEQKEWLAALKAEGYKTAICKGADAAIKAIETYLALPKQN